MIITLDFETYYAKDFSVKQLGVLQYIRDPRFKIHGVGVQVDDQPIEWWTDRLGERLKALDWAKATLVGHNLYFDGSILFEQWGIVPHRRIDTLSMAKGLFTRGESVSLDNVAQMLGLGSKIKGTLANTKDLVTLDAELLAQLGEYCREDVRLTRAVYDQLIQGMPAGELDLIDITLRMATAPILEIDLAMATKARLEADIKRTEAIRNSGQNEKDLGSNVKFVKILQEHGIDVPLKTSPTTGKLIPALGQRDPAFIDLMAAHPELQPLWDARAEVKSALNLTRAAKWIYIATHGSKKMPMPLHYYGAHTGRWSGMDGINVQNLPRNGLLRKAIIAPKDHVILVADSAQIELRVNAWFAGQEDVLETLRNGKDVYRLMGSALFEKSPENVTKDERQFSKAVVLGCGYGMGAGKFQHYCASGPLGMKPIHISLEEAQRVIRTYREANSAIVALWKDLDTAASIMKLIDTRIVDDAARFKGADQPFRCVRLQYERIELPNGMHLDYSGLRPGHSNRNADTLDWWYGAQRPLWGGTLTENIVQALARIVVADQLLAIDQLDGVQVVGCTHDEVIAVCHQDVAQTQFERCIDIMSTPPAWAPDLPLDAEGGFAANYSK
jgi:DNA polymerase